MQRKLESGVFHTCRKGPSDHVHSGEQRSRRAAPRAAHVRHRVHRFFIDHAWPPRRAAASFLLYAGA